jgi:hypothetical protein
MKPAAPARDARGPRINRADLVAVAVAGQIAHPVARPEAHRIGHDGVPRVLPATGGIVLNFRVGDRCVGLAGDHIEPGVSLHNNGREIVGPRNGPNMALMTYAAVGNRARVLSGAAAGATGLVTGKHGGVDHVLVDFPPAVLRRLAIGDRVQIESIGLGLRLLDYPDVAVHNAAPALLARWGLQERDGRLQVPVTHRLPAALMGSGLGRNTVARGDYDIQLADATARRRYRLGSLRFGDMVAIVDADTRRGPAWRRGRVTMGVIVHGDSVVSGHGPGVVALLTGPLQRLLPVHRPDANLAAMFGLRPLPPAREHATLTDRTAAQGCALRAPLPRAPTARTRTGSAAVLR